MIEPSYGKHTDSVHNKSHHQSSPTPSHPEHSQAHQMHGDSRQAPSPIDTLGMSEQKVIIPGSGIKPLGYEHEQI